MVAGAKRRKRAYVAQHVYVGGGQISPTGGLHAADSRLATSLEDRPSAALPASAIKYVTNAYICAPASPCLSKAPAVPRPIVHFGWQTTRIRTRCT